MSGLINDATGTAIFIGGILKPFGFNHPTTIVIYGVVMAIEGALAGYPGFIVFKISIVTSKARD